MRTSRRRPSSVAAALFLLAAGLVAPPPAAAQIDPAAERSGQSRSGPRELGEIGFPASARSAEALRHFQRGVAALHSFWYDEAADAFRAAWEAEPGFALAAWGEAMTCNHPIWKEVDLDCGRAALARLGATPEERAAAAPTARERAWLAAVETLYTPEGDKRSRDLAYERAMADLAAAGAGTTRPGQPAPGESTPAARRPDDVEAAGLRAATGSDHIEAAAFHALALQGLVYGGHLEDGERFPTLMRSAAALERLFDRAPRHPGVLHYLIHAYDDPVHAPLGLRAAELYAEVAPAAHHALHMPSHIFVQLGRWDDAVASNEDAWAASVAWQTDRGHGIDRRDFHSLSWQLYAELQQGRREAAARTIDLARRSLAESDGHRRVASAVERMEARYEIETGEAPPADHSGAGGAVPADPAHAAHGGATGDAGEAPADPAHAAHGGAGGEALFARGLAAARAGDPAAAEALAARLAEDGGTDSRVMALELEGLALLARERPDQAVARLAEAAELEATMPPPSGPPEPPKPAHELLGEVLLDLGRPAEAADAFATSLRRTPRRPASLLGAARAARAAGDPAIAHRHATELAAIWRAADPDHPGLDEVRSLQR